MDKLLAGLILLGLALLVLIATIVHFATRLDGDVKHERPVLESEPDPSLPDGGSVVLTIGGGRELTAGPDGPAPLPTQPQRTQGQLTGAEKQAVDDRGYLSYTVQKGDTLYKLSERYLGSGALSGQIMRHNPELDRPENLRTGMRLRIPLWLKEHSPTQPQGR
ncbi:MAG: LysM peptidoglycan-binding domain-containing protein [Planctomycetes bacterium]|nr:LysM peptidoglycan-binding domain-containing protein [Planctomycetota bacterium]